MCVCVCLPRDKPRTISDGERMAALYNIACCHAKLNDPRTGLVALAGKKTVPIHMDDGTCDAISDPKQPLSHVNCVLIICG